MPQPQITFLKSRALLPVTGADICVLQWFNLLQREHGWRVAVMSTCGGVPVDSISPLLAKLGIPSTRDGDALLYPYGDITVRILDREFTSETAHSVPGTGVVAVNCRDLVALRAARTHATRRCIGFLSECSPPPLCDQEILAAEYPDLLAGLMHVFTVSRFLGKYLADQWCCPSTVLLNLIDGKGFAPQNSIERRYIALVNPTTAKGVDVAIGLARHFPERRFLFIGGIGEDYRARRTDYRQIPNIEVVPFQGELASVYESVRLLIVPSVCPEAFSRVVLEAHAAGVPVVAADVGGIREAGDDAAIYIPPQPHNPYEWARSDIEGWIAAIQSLDNPSNYTDLRQRGFARMQRYESECAGHFCSFEGIIRKIALS